MDIMRQSAGLVLNPIMVYSYGFLFNYMVVGQASDRKMTLWFCCSTVLFFAGSLFCNNIVLRDLDSFAITLLRRRKIWLLNFHCDVGVMRLCVPGNKF